MRTRTMTAASVLLAAMLGGCAADTGTEDPADTIEDSDELDASKADSLASTSTYYQIRRDYRRCIAPLCGGYWVKRVNQVRTRCHDGSYRSECYVADADWSALGGAEASGELVVRGSIARQDWGDPFGMQGRLVVTEAWSAGGTTAPDGVFYRLRDNGIRCITHPCNSIHEAKLNATFDREIAGLDLSGAGASDEALERGYGALASDDGVIAVGGHVRVRGPAGRSYAFEATQFYVRVAPDALGQPCGSRGLSACPDGYYCDWPDGAMCGYADGAGTCQARPEACIELYDPVCGCDGQTYGNDCDARSAGIDVLHAGACPGEGECAREACGPALGLPNYLCDDGVTTAGPTGRCLQNADGTCGWEVLSCT